ncbi:hypothetical protein NSPZN2_100399 [Nitrospira defluvii]|uniref:Transposase n=1 Tax=Nitrospira defluvii TaxID=330214 RepID=A0ABM8R438_9BACT|nr:hypothetical protein NSPZN2_100399 [Nitrospira defluvii]
MREFVGVHRFFTGYEISCQHATTIRILRLVVAAVSRAKSI